MNTLFDVLSNLPDRVALGDLDSLVLISLKELEQGVDHNSAGKRVDNYIDALIGFRNSIEGTTIDFGIPYDDISYAAGKRLGEKVLENISKLRSINSYPSIKTADLVFEQFRKFTSRLEDEFRSLRFILNHTYLFLIDGIAGQDSNEVNADFFKTAIAFEFNRHYKWVSRLARGEIAKEQATKLKGKHTTNNYMKLGCIIYLMTSLMMQRSFSIRQQILSWLPLKAPLSLLQTTLLLLIGFSGSFSNNSHKTFNLR